MNHKEQKVHFAKELQSKSPATRAGLFEEIS
jgi:hypothetical protein